MSVIDNRSFQDIDIFLFAQGFKVAHRAQVDVRRIDFEHEIITLPLK